MASLSTGEPTAVERMRAALAADDLAAASEAYNVATKASPGDEGIVIEYAQAVANRGHDDLALRVLEAAIADNPETVELRLSLGRALLVLGRTKPAAELMKTALGLAPDNEDAAIGRAAALRELDDLEAALATLDAALAHHPDSQDLRKMIGSIEAERGRWEAALEAFRALDPADEDGPLGQFNALLALGRHADAQAVIEAAVRARPESAAFRSNLAWIQLLRWRPDKAAETFARAVELGADDGSTAVGRARALRELARYREAVEVIDAALERHADDLDLQIEAGQTGLAMHDYEAAAAAFRRAKELNKKDVRAQNGLKSARLRTGYWRILKRPCRAFDRGTRQVFALTTPALAVIDETSRLDPPLRTAVKAAVSRFAWRRARVSATIGMLGNAFGIGILVTWIAVAAAVPFVIGRQGGPEGATGFDLVFAYIGVVTVPLLLPAFLLPVIRFGRPTLFVVLGLAFLYALLAVVAAGEADQLHPTAASLIVWSLTASAVELLLVVGYALVLIAGESAWLRHVDQDEPHTACMHALADVLARLQDGIVLTDRAQVAEATKQLERAASLLRAHLKGEPTGDLRTDAWLAKRADGHAEALREYKKALLSPAVGSLDTLRRRLGDDLVQIARGLWRHLPWTDPGPATAKTRRLLLRTVVRTGVIAVGPLALVLLISGQDWFGLGGHAADELKLIAVGWAFLSILMPLDPRFGEKFAALRGGAGLIRSGGSSKS